MGIVFLCVFLCVFHAVGVSVSRFAVRENEEC